MLSSALCLDVDNPQIRRSHKHQKKKSREPANKRPYRQQRSRKPRNRHDALFRAAQVHTGAGKAAEIYVRSSAGNYLSKTLALFLPQINLYGEMSRSLSIKRATSQMFFDTYRTNPQYYTREAGMNVSYSLNKLNSFAQRNAALTEYAQALSFQLQHTIQIKTKLHLLKNTVEAQRQIEAVHRNALQCYESTRRILELRAEAGEAQPDTNEAALSYVAAREAETRSKLSESLKKIKAACIEFTHMTNCDIDEFDMDDTAVQSRAPVHFTKLMYKNPELLQAYMRYLTAVDGLKKRSLSWLLPQVKVGVIVKNAFDQFDYIRTETPTRVQLMSSFQWDFLNPEAFSEMTRAQAEIAHAVCEYRRQYFAAMEKAIDIQTTIESSQEIISVQFKAVEEFAKESNRLKQLLNLDASDQSVLQRCAEAQSRHADALERLERLKATYIEARVLADEPTPPFLLKLSLDKPMQHSKRRTNTRRSARSNL